MTENAYDLVTLTPITPPGPGLRVHLVGDDDLAGGVGGWSVISRPRRRDALEWSGEPGWQKKLPLRLDGMDFRDDSEDVSVEEEINRLISWGKPSPATDEPTVLALGGPLIVPPWVTEWVIADISWGVRVRRGDQHRIAQEVEVTLLEYVQAEVLLGPAAAARARAGT